MMTSEIDPPELLRTSTSSGIDGSEQLMSDGGQEDLLISDEGEEKPASKVVIPGDGILARIVSSKRHKKSVLAYCLLAVSVVTVIVLLGIFIHRSGPNSKRTTEAQESLGQVETSPADSAEYLTFRMENGVKVLLISQESDVDDVPLSISVNVAAGSLDEPKDVPGLAHFLEHMLFLGSKKYPGEDEFQRHIGDHGGYTNAQTGADYTNYHLKVEKDGAAKAVDMLAQFFISPLLNADAVSREAHAVDSEYRNGISSDAFRLDRLFRLTADKKSPMSRFTVGSLETLSQPDIRTRLRHFYTEHYTADRLTIGMWSSFGLSQMKTLIEKSFKGIPKTSSPKQVLQEPFPKGFPRRMARYKTVSGSDVLHVFFPLDSIRDDYRQNPSSLILELLSHEAEGSVLAKLRALGWAKALYGNTYESTAGWTILNFDITLTDTGKNHVNKIVSLMFQYIRLIGDSGITKQAWDDVQAPRKLYFRYTKPIINPIASLVTLTRRLSFMSSAADLLGAPSRQIWEPSLIMKVLGQLNPDNVVILIGQNNDVSLKSYDQLFKFNYSIESISPSTRADWHLAPLDSDLSLPPRNHFIPSSETLASLSNQARVQYPVLAINQLGRKLWWYPNAEFSQEPTQTVTLDIVSNDSVVHTNPVWFHAAMILWQEMAQQALATGTYNALLAGFKYSLSYSTPRIHLSVTGYADDKVLRAYLKLVLEGVFDRIDRTGAAMVFKRSQASVVKLYRSFDRRHSLAEHASFDVEKLLLQLTSNEVAHEGVLAMLENTTLPQLRSFVKAFRRHLTTVGLLHGSLPQLQSKSLFQSITDVYGGIGFNLDTVDFQRAYRITTPSASVFRHVSTEEASINSLVVDNIQLGSTCVLKSSSIDNFRGGCTEESLRSHVLAEKLTLQLSHAFFAELRTKQQLGYLVECYTGSYYGELHLYGLVVSPGHNVTDVHSRIQAFYMQHMYGDVMQKQMTDSEHWGRLHRSLSTRLKQPWSALSEITNWMFKEISLGRLQFDLNKQIEAMNDKMDSTSGHDLMAFFGNALNDNKRQLTIQIFSKDNTVPLNGTGVIPESGIDSWRKMQTPVPQNRVSYGI